MRWLLPLWLVLATVGRLSASPQSEEETYREPAEEEDRVSLTLRLGDERGGGQVEVLAGDFDYQEGEYFLGTGGVTVKYRDVRLSADVVRLDIATELLTAEGAVVLDEGPRRLVGDAIEYNLETRTGRITHATAYLDSSYVFKGDEISKLEEDTYSLDEGIFTSCSEEKPPWSIRMGHAKVTVENYARIKNARMRLGKVPIFYVPYMVWPTKTERSSGLLVPQPGYSNRRGFELSLAYYQTLGRSADTTFYFDLSSRQFYGFGNEVRYRPSETTEGLFQAFVLQDQDFKRLRDIGFSDLPAGFTFDDLPEETRWKVSWFHDARDLWGGFRGVINFQDYSDPTYRQDFERNVRGQTANFIYSQAYLTRNIGQQSLNFLVDVRERITSRFFREDPTVTGDERRVGRITDTRRQLPEMEYRLRPTQLGSSPLYFSLDANLHYLSVENNSLSRRDANNDPIAERYGRGDLFPNFSLPLSTLPWLAVKLDVGGRVTHYTNSLDPQTRRFAEDARALTRTFGAAGAEIVGPSFSRIFEKKHPGRFSKLKHVVEPRFVYAYLDDFQDTTGEDVFPDEDAVPLFDEIDSQRLRNEATVSLINRLLAKPTNEEEGGGFEIASFEIQQSFSFDSRLFLQRGRDQDMMLKQKREGPLRAIFRFNPSQGTSLKAEGAYNTLFGQMQSLSLSGAAQLGKHTFGGSLFTRWGSAEDADITSNQARLFTTLALVPNRLTFDAQVSYDIEQGELLQQRYFLDFRGSCYGLRLEVRESTFGDVTDTDFRFAFTLKNVGTFIDLNGNLN